MAVEFPLPGAEQIGPLGLIGEQPSPVIAPQGIDPNARAKVPLGDEWAEFPEVPEPSTESFDEFSEVDELDARPAEDLSKDRDNFNPVSYFEENPDLAESPERLSKLLQVYRTRRQEGLEAGRVAKAAVKEAPGMLKKFAVGVRDVGANIIDTALQPTANVLGAAITGDLADPERRSALFSETRRNLKKSVAELSAAEESTSTSLADLARQGVRKAETTRIPDDLPRTRVGTANVAPEKPKTDQELLAEISDDVEFRKTAAEVLRGEGEFAKAVGLDAEALAREGVSLDKDAIESLSMADPLTTVGSAGALRLVSASGKVLATARTAAGIDKVTSGLGKLAKSATEKSVGRTVQGVGKATGAIGTAIKSRGIAAATTVGSLMSGQGVPASALAGAATQVAGITARKVGPVIEAAGERIATKGNIAIDALSKLPSAAAKVTEGAALGAASTAPLAVLTDDDQAAGSILGAGIALGAAGAGAETGFRVVRNKAAQTLFGPSRAPIPDIPSTAYGKNNTLDFAHQENLANLSDADRAEVNQFRELVRPSGSQIYVVDRGTFRQKIADTFAAETGKELTPEALNNYEKHHAFFDPGSPTGEKIVYLNSDIKGLQHDAGHIFDALLPEEKRAELRDAVKKAFSQDQIEAFKKRYQEDAKTSINDDAVMNEFVAEQFSSLFRNVPANELAAPVSLVSKFGRALAEQADKWGIDLTGGVTTPDLGAPVTVGVRNLFRDAARTVAEAGNPRGTRGGPVPTPPNVVAFPGAEVSPPPRPPTPPPEPPAPTPPVASATALAPAPSAPNIRVTKAQQDAFSHRNAETGIARARELAANDPVVAARVEEISKSLEQGNPVLEISHLGITSETPAAGRRTRVGEQEAGYSELDRLQIENRAEAPASVVSRYQKTFSPVRWVEQGGTPTLLAMSMDKVISNITRVAKESVGKGVEDLIPYKIGEDGKFTADSWNQIMKDNTAYGENQANGFRGDGKKLIRPGVDVGLSIPAENPNYTPTILSDDVMNFHNLIQGLNTPGTAREIRGQTPGNIKGQLVAEANKRTLLEPASIRPRNAGKQEFVSFPGRKVAEVNPLRRDLIARGLDIDSLLPVTERLRAADIVSVKPRPELNFKAAQTDIVRGGFLPATEFRRKNLSGRTVDEFSDYIVKLTPGEWKETTDAFQGGLTGGAWSLGLSLTDASHVGVLKSFQEKLSTAAKDAMLSGDFDAAYSLVSKGQFFREAYEAATGTGSAGAAFKRNVMGTEGVKVPFPAEEQPKK